MINFTFTLGVFILSFVAYRVWFEKPDVARATPWAVAPIAIVAVNGDLERLLTAVALNQPTILRETGAAQWAVMAEWQAPAALKATYVASRPLKNDRGLLNFQEQLPEHVSVMSSTGRVFSYMNDAPLAGNFSWPLRAAPVSRLRERPAFLIEWLRMQRNLQPVHGGYFALTQAVTRESTPLVEHLMLGAVFRKADVKPVPTSSRMPRSPPTKDVTRLWVGRGTITHTHIDESRNFYTQIRGEKTFRLWPPRAHRALRLFPESHPAYRQAQATLREAPPAWEVTLRAGDTLYIPPLHFHHATAGAADLSISVSVWRESAVQRLRRRMLAHRMPSEVISKCRERPRTGGAKPDELLAETQRQRIACALPLRPFVRAVVAAADQSRSLERGGLSSGGAVDAFLRLDVLVRWRSDELQPFCRRAWPGGPAPGDDGEGAAAQVQAEARGAVAAAVARELTVDGVPQMSRAVVQIILADYVEVVARTFLGADHVCSFVKYCLAG